MQRPQAVSTDFEIVRSYLSGNEQAFNELVLRYEFRLRQFVSKLIGDRERAKDVVQEVFLRVFKNLHRFDGSKKFSTWIYVIAANLAKNERRDRKRSRTTLFSELASNGFDPTGHMTSFSDPSALPDKQLEEKELRLLLERTMSSVSPVKQRVLRLRELSGLSYEEIATTMDCKEGTVKSRLHRGRDSMRKYLDENPT